MRKKTDDERELGLDPSKYSQKPFNPSKFISDSPAESEPPEEVVNKVIDEMREKAAIKAQQEEILGKSGEPSADEKEVIRKRMLEMIGR